MVTVPLTRAEVAILASLVAWKLGGGPRMPPMPTRTLRRLLEKLDNADG